MNVPYRELRLGFETAYIDDNVASNTSYKPQFVSNNYKEGKKVLASIEDELLACDRFQISVAFITLGEIEPLLQTLSRDNVLSQFDKYRFDCIVIDETHKAGAESYHKIINHFKPKLLLGMTASPERTDGFDIYKLFDHNIASEIRLQDALKDDLLCPFHYFGISDLTIDGIEIDEKTEFRYLATEERVNHVIEKAEYFGHDGDRVKV